ncbi:13301_t:CDS:2 [Acaulospora colombiana]|uniref:13301_t:CDS:1 n=1 Tax=Acaulospora colombiana TaxID=27376 RepID=A0ACA9NJZ6_9GLOM|nr:13301_t:CDS:2 [Acaulospora colombiana]
MGMKCSVLIGGGDKSVFYWDVTTGQTIRRIPGHLSRINTVAFNQDASVVVSGSFDSTVKIWDLKYGFTSEKSFVMTVVASRAIAKSPIQSLEDSKDAIQALHVGHHEIITGSVDGHVRTYDLRKGQMTSDYLGRE